MALLQQAQRRFALDSSLYGVALSACRRGSDWQQALSLAQQCPELVAGVFTLQACEGAQAAKACRAFAEELKERLEAPRAELYQAKGLEVSPLYTCLPCFPSLRL